MTAEPKLFTKNYVNSESDLTFSSGSTLGERIADNDKNSQWISSGENSDATESTVVAIFKEGGVEVEKSIDTVILINHNLEDPIVEYWDGSAWQSFDSETDLTDGTATVFTHATVSTSRIKVRNSQTITTNQEKAIGELIACLSLVSFSRDFVSYNFNLVPRKAFELPLGDGSIHRSVVMSSLNRSSKYEANVRFDFLTAAEIEILQGIKESADVVTWQPESIERPDEIYQVNWTGNFAPIYVTSYKGAGYRADFNFKET